MHRPPNNWSRLWSTERPTNSLCCRLQIILVVVVDVVNVAPGLLLALRGRGVGRVTQLQVHGRVVVPHGGLLVEEH